MNRVKDDNVQKNRRLMIMAAIAFAVVMLVLMAFQQAFPKISFVFSLFAATAVTAVFLWCVQQMINRATRLREEQTYVLTREVDLASRCGQMLVFVFKRENGRLLACRDGLMGTEESAQAAPVTLYELERLIRMHEEDGGKISEAAGKLMPGQSWDLDARSTWKDGTHVLSIKLKCMRNSPGIVIGCAMDSTRMIALREYAVSQAAFAAAMQPKCMSVWQINATRNEWKCTYCVNPAILKSLGMQLGRPTNYEASLTGKVKERLDPQDYYGYTETMTCEGISGMLRTGKTDFSEDYRILKLDGSDYEWHRQTIRIFVDPDSGEILCNMFVQNVNEEKKAELERRARARIMQKSLTALGGVFFGLYYIDLNKEICYTAKARSGEIVSTVSAPFAETMKKYAEKYVHPDDRAGFLQAVDAYRLRRDIAEGSRHIQYGYRGMRAEVYYWSSMFIQPARFENGKICDVVIALQRSENKVS